MPPGDLWILLLIPGGLPGRYPYICCIFRRNDSPLADRSDLAHLRSENGVPDFLPDPDPRSEWIPEVPGCKDDTVFHIIPQPVRSPPIFPGTSLRECASVHSTPNAVTCNILLCASAHLWQVVLFIYQKVLSQFQTNKKDIYLYLSICPSFFQICYFYRFAISSMMSSQVIPRSAISTIM